MGRWIVPLLAVWGVVLPSTAASSPSLPTAAPLDDGSAPPTECVEASQSEHASRRDTTIVTLDNECKVSVRCKIEWTVECKGGETHPIAHAATLTAGASQSFEASASMCAESGWRISPPTWSCSSG